MDEAIGLDTFPLQMLRPAAGIASETMAIGAIINIEDTESMTTAAGSQQPTPERAWLHRRCQHNGIRGLPLWAGATVYKPLGKLDKDADDTFCPECGTPVIKHLGHLVDIVCLDGDRCGSCGRRMDVVRRWGTDTDAPSGTCGACRMHVRMQAHGLRATGEAHACP